VDQPPDGRRIHVIGAGDICLRLAGGKPLKGFLPLMGRQLTRPPELHAALLRTPAAFAGSGAPIIGKLLGHTQASTTQRYAHLDADPLRRASEAIGGQIAAALDGRRAGSVVQLKDIRRR